MASNLKIDWGTAPSSNNLKIDWDEEKKKKEEESIDLGSID